MERIADLLARKFTPFNTTTPDCRVSDALYKMCCEDVDFLMVMEDNKFKGIISDHDVSSRILFDKRPLQDICVSEFMNTSLPVASPTDSLQSCMKVMERYNARHVAVYDRFAFKGVISSYDLMNEFLQQAGKFVVAGEEPRRGYPWTY